MVKMLSVGVGSIWFGGIKTILGMWKLGIIKNSL